MTRITLLALAVASVIAASAPSVGAQTAGRGRGQTPAKPAKPAAPAKPAPAAKPAEPPKPVAQDLLMKTVYTNGDQKTESVTFRQGERERFEFGDVVLLKQHDLKRTVQIMKAANTYMVVPDGAAPPALSPAPAGANAAPPTPGVVNVTTTITDTGEQKAAFGAQARHVKTVIDKQPMPGACDPAKQHIETDGWYIDVPAQSVPDAPMPAAPAACVDEVKATQNGDPKVLGFPIAYTTTMTGDDGKPNVVSMEVTEFEITMLDAALFDIPAGMTEAPTLQALTRAVSDANETKLAQELTSSAPPAQKAAGTMLVGVPELINKTTQQVDTRALRGRLVSELSNAKLSAAPLSGAQADLPRAAGSHGYDYVLVAEVTEVKVSSGGGKFGGVLKAATKVAGAGNGQDPTEAAIAIKLVQPDGRTRLTTTAKGKDGGFDLKAGLNVAKFAGTMYMNMMTGRLMMNALSQSMTGNLGGMGLLGNPAMANAQAQGLGARAGMTMGLGVDPTARAASFLMQQSLASHTAAGNGGAQGGPSVDAALGDALQNAAKSVAENLKKGQPKK
ncbi:MAG TPA: hypothetical protein VLV86_07240 [Vicinamibacterales bacterium]|nr:hypothetical protein [Vicinamibacterales bacterium]